MNTALKIALVFLVIPIHISLAQQTPVYAEYHYNPILINSAYTGILSSTEFNLSSAALTSSFDGSPSTSTASINIPLRNGKMGVGAGLIIDNIGITQATRAYASYSYKIELDFIDPKPYYFNYDKPILSFGLSLGGTQFSNNYLDLDIVDDPQFSANTSYTLYQFGFGVLFNKGNMYAGLSTPNILGDLLTNDNALEYSTPFYATAGYRFFSNRFKTFTLHPSILLKYENGTPLQLDTNFSIRYKEFIEVGAGYRTTSSINFMLGTYLFKNFRIVYYYNTGESNSALGSRHGLLASYKLGNGYKEN